MVRAIQIVLCSIMNTHKPRNATYVRLHVKVVKTKTFANLVYKILVTIFWESACRAVLINIFRRSGTTYLYANYVIWIANFVKNKLKTVQAAKKACIWRFQSLIVEIKFQENAKYHAKKAFSHFLTIIYAFLVVKIVCHVQFFLNALPAILQKVNPFCTKTLASHNAHLYTICRLSLIKNNARHVQICVQYA
jgi:hypothetical protein